MTCSPISHEVLVITVMAIIVGLVMLAVDLLARWRTQAFYDRWARFQPYSFICYAFILGITAIGWALYGVYLVAELIL